MRSEQFYLMLSGGDKMVMQAPKHRGEAVTLERLHPGTRHQLWTLQPQAAEGFSGVAFVNTHTGNSVTFNGLSQPLIVQRYHPNSDEMDAWYLSHGSGGGDLQIACIKDPKYFWQNWGGRAEPGDSIRPHNDVPIVRNTAWNFRLVSEAELQDTDADPAYADATVSSSEAEPAGRT